LLGGYLVNLKEAFIHSIMSPTFMLGMWHGVDWMKERFGSAQSMVGWFMEVLDLVGFAFVNNISFPLVFYM
jgi:hypothetical protein